MELEQIKKLISASRHQVMRHLTPSLSERFNDAFDVKTMSFIIR